MPIEFPKLHTVDRFANHPESNPDQQRRDNVDNQHRQKSIPWRFDRNRPTKGLTKLQSHKIACHDRRYGSELPSEAFDRTKQHGTNQNHNHDDVINLHQIEWGIELDGKTLAARSVPRIEAPQSWYC